MSFDTYLNNHMVAFACYKDGREGPQNQNQNQKHPIHSHSLHYKPLYSKEIIERIMFCKGFL
jgi:hypothetical protein